ncbi:MAG: cadherin-like beta sandwich domain-containing protein [Oscillospiraceae bacterium]|jgi:hypothetical protein|nr:cadherin-like beta sandwich domain-containing protein [Oscillospiraceae bacterium]
MNRKNKKFIIKLLITVLYFCLAPACFSESDFTSAKLICDNTCAKAGKSLKIKAMINSYSELSVNAFKFTVKYDSGVFNYNNFTAPKGTCRKNFNVRAENDLLYVEYVCKKSDLLVNQSLNICNFTFDSKNDIDPHECKFEFQSFEIVDGNKRNFSLSDWDDLTINFEQIAKPNCYLSCLTPSCGRLVPDFSKDILEYSVNVDYDISFIDFDICCENEFANGEISRRKLASAGKDTKINITVKDKKAKSKLVYVVNVHRCEKSADGKKISEGTPAKNESGTSCKKIKKSKTKSSGDKSKSLKIKPENDNINIDNTDNDSDNDSGTNNYVALDSAQEDDNSKNYFDERLIGGLLVILFLGGLLIYKKFSVNKCY